MNKQLVNIKITNKNDNMVCDVKSKGFNKLDTLIAIQSLTFSMLNELYSIDSDMTVDLIKVFIEELSAMIEGGKIDVLN